MLAGLGSLREWGEYVYCAVGRLMSCDSAMVLSLLVSHSFKEVSGESVSIEVGRFIKIISLKVPEFE